MKTAVQQWGNSLALRIPTAFAAQVGIKRGTPLNLTLERGRLVVTSETRRDLSLRELLSKVTTKNIHRKTDWGPAAGKKAW